MALVIVIVLFIAVWIFSLIKKGNRIINAKENYEQALQGTDKSYALQLGRNYYSLKNGGYLTSYDEQVLANDLSTMRQQISN